MNLRALLEDIAAGRRTVEAVETALRGPGFVDLGFANVDVDRQRRCGLPEVIYGEGKPADQIATIARELYRAHGRVLATRVSADVAQAACAALDDLPVRYEAVARCLVIEAQPAPDLGRGPIAVISAGTSDAPVAAEAAITAAACGNRVDRLNDVGVAGIHRLLARADRLRAAAVLVVVAGMEGALPSVVAGLVDKPVIAVPTSVGYGASFGGLAALLAMLNTCASGVTVVNIDNGFGAAYAATLMNRA